MGMAVKHIFILAGEASGDVLGAEFIMSLRQVEPNTRITFTGGQAMADALQGQSPLIPLSKLAFMGFAEVVAHLPQVWANDQKIKQHIQKEKPDAPIEELVKEADEIVASEVKARQEQREKELKESEEKENVE